MGDDGDRAVLLAVPNFSVGRDDATIDAIGAALTAGGDVRLLATHRDPDHNRSVFTLAGAPGTLAPAASGSTCVRTRACTRTSAPSTWRRSST